MTASKTEPNTPEGNRSGKHLPGEVGVWLFIFGDMMVFSLFFFLFLHYRSLDIVTFTDSQALLNLNYGAINTLFLLTSSWFVVLGLQSIRNNRAVMARRFFQGAFICGVGFGVIKFFEWGEKIRAGHTLTSNDFFMYYYIFTGIHFLHVLIGMGILAFLVMKTRTTQFAPGDEQTFESGGAYWHMVDLLWIVLFPLLYLVR